MTFVMSLMVQFEKIIVSSPFSQLLNSMDPDKNLELLRKADWHTSLKPRQNDDYAWIRPKKRQQVESISETTPPPVSKAEFSLIKTPCPDITVGPRHHLFVHTLVERAQVMELQGILRPGCWTKGYADRKLKTLQEQGMLISDPTQQGIIRFPAMVVEGKAYSSDKLILEAQNQSIVSGACITFLQEHNSDLANTTGSDPERGEPCIHASQGQNKYRISGACIADLQQQNAAPANKAPLNPHSKKLPILGFSMSSEGPYLELCAHTITWDSEDNARDFDMYIIKSCNISVLEEVIHFLMLVEDVEVWMTGPYLDNMADQVILGDKASWSQKPNDK